MEIQCDCAPQRCSLLDAENEKGCEFQGEKDSHLIMMVLSTSKSVGRRVNGVDSTNQLQYEREEWLEYVQEIQI